MRTTLLLIAGLLAACSKPATGPTPIDGVDPTVQVVNPTTETLRMTWYAQTTGVVSTTVIAPGATTCSHLIVPITDSVMIVTWTPVYDPQGVITNFDSAFTIVSGVPRVRGTGPVAFTYSRFFVAGQPIIIVNGQYVSDFWTVQAAPNPGHVPAAYFTNMGADSTAPC